jgi:hypothetical protein
MKEKRKFNRWYPVADFHTELLAEDTRERVRVLDISATGMKTASSRGADIGTEVYSKLEIPSTSVPFFVQGTVRRVAGCARHWEIVIAFARVSMQPFAGVTF